MKFFCLFCFFTITLFAKPTVCLNMIVKNEGEVIEECLDSVKPFIDYWVIFDTGSTDDTKVKIKRILKDVPGELHVSEWVDFAYNRNVALKAAKKKADYLLFIDADEKLLTKKDFELPLLDKDFYTITLKQSGTLQRTTFVKADLNWEWKGVLHEELNYEDAETSEHLDGIVNISCEGVSGRCKDPYEIKYYKDALVLEKALEKEPDNDHYLFYLGVSYLASNHYQKAIDAFKKRIKLPNADPELTFWAIYNSGQAYEKMDKTEEAIHYYLMAHSKRPFRAEPLFNAAKIYRKQNKPFLGYLLIQHALKIPYPHDEKMVDHQIYERNLQIEFANCTLLLGKFEEAYEACAKLLQNPNIPEEFLKKIQSNYELAKKNLW